MRFVLRHFSASAIYSVVMYHWEMYHPRLNTLQKREWFAHLQHHWIRRRRRRRFVSFTSCYHTTFAKRKENRKQKTFPQGKNVSKRIHASKECSSLVEECVGISKRWNVKKRFHMYDKSMAPSAKKSLSLIFGGCRSAAREMCMFST